MEITIFAKKRTTKEGKSFYNYLSTLEKKDGTTITVGVKFDEEHRPAPAECPMNIIVEKTNCNLSTKHGVTSDGKEWVNNTLWVKDWTKSDNAWVDTSMDDFV